MTPERRLDQLEPVMGEMAAQLDLHSTQLRQIAAGIKNIVGAISQQSDNIAFLLEGQANHTERLTAVETRLDRVETKQDQQGEMLRTILNILQNRSDN